MKAIVIQQYGGPEQLVIQEVPDPGPAPGQVVIEVKAFGLNHAETYMRKGLWGEVAKVSGIDAVLDLVGNTTVLDSLAMLRRHGRVCEAGFLGGLSPIESFNPIAQVPSGVQFSFFGSFVFGSPAFPLSDIPFQTIFDRVAEGKYRAKPARTFRFEEIQDAHRLMELNQANGKIVVAL